MPTAKAYFPATVYTCLRAHERSFPFTADLSAEELDLLLSYSECRDRGQPKDRTPTIGDVVKGIDDVLKKDQKVPLSRILLEAGWVEPSVRKEALKIVWAESRGDPNADNGVCCVGLFQVNRSWAGKLGLGEPNTAAAFTEWLKDPFNNARAARYIWSENSRSFARQPGGVSQWEVRDNGSWLNAPAGFDPIITVKEHSLIGDPLEAVETAVSGPIRAIGDLIEALFQPSTWFRIGKGTLGGVFVIAGVAAVVFIVANNVKRSSTVAATQRTAGPPVRKAAKAAKSTRSVPY